MSSKSAFDALKKSLAAGEISRREFAVRAAALGAAASVPAVSSAKAAPKKGGHFKIGIGHGSTSDSMDPGAITDTYMQTVSMVTRNCLTEIDGNDELVGELAESWTSSKGADVWNFKLRKGVEFHNGKSLDADDVIASLTHHITEDSTSVVKAIFKPITGMKAIGKNEVQITLSEGNADFPYLASDYHAPIMPAKDGKADWQSGMGTGGYTVEKFEPGIRTHMKRHPNYWKDGFAHFDEVESLVIHDSAARTSALKSGSIHAMDRPELKTIKLLQRDSSIKVVETQGTLHFTYPMLTDVAPFNDPDVRLALKYAIDRQEILDKVIKGHGYIGNDHPIGKSNAYYAADLPQRPYDPDKAKFHLKKAGMSGLKVELSAADAAFEGSVEGAVLFSEAAKKAGIDIKPVREPNDGYWSNVWMVKPWSTSYWSGRATEDWMFTVAYARGAEWNETRWDNDRFNKLLVAARVELDDSKRREMYFEMQKLCNEDGGAIVPAFQNNVFAMHKSVATPGNLSAAWDLDGLKCLERWWFA